MPIQITGLTETRAALRKFEPDLLKESDRAMRVVLKVIVEDARRFVPNESPLRNWDISASSTREGRWSGDRAFSPGPIRVGIVSSIGNSKTNSKGFKVVYSILNKSAAGAIYETAGRKNPNGDPKSKSRNPKAGKQFIDAVQKQSVQSQPHGTHEGRLAFAAVKKNQGKASQAIRLSVAHAEFLFKARTNARSALGGK